MVSDGIKVDAVICDPPYGTTGLKWDNILDSKRLIPLLNKVLKTRGWLIIFGNEPFYSYFLVELLNSKLFIYSHEIIWNKIVTGSPLMANQQPMRIHEKIMVLKKNIIGEFYEKTPAYKVFRSYIEKYVPNITNNQFAKMFKAKSASMVSHWLTTQKQWTLIQEEPYNEFKRYIKTFFGENILEYSELKKLNINQNKQTYNPYTKVFDTKRIKSKTKGQIKHLNNDKEFDKISTGWTNYPKSIVSFNRDYDKYHPTQKPVLLMEHLIKMYSNEGDFILDFTMGSGSTGVAALKSKRLFVGIEKDKEYFEIAKKRLEAIINEAKQIRIIEI